MKRINYLFLAFALFSLTISCEKVQQVFQDQEIVPAAEKSCGFLQNSFGQRVSWKNSFPIQFKLNKSIPEASRALILRAVEDWNKKLNFEALKMESLTDSSETWANEGVNVIYQISAPGIFTNTLIQAKSLIRWSGNRIVDVDIILNAYDWKLGDSKTETQVLDLESLLVHEFGHSLGLVHQEFEESVMFPTLNLMTIRNMPSDKPELEDFKCEYSSNTQQ